MSAGPAPGTRYGQLVTTTWPWTETRRRLHVAVVCDCGTNFVARLERLTTGELDQCARCRSRRRAKP